MKKFLFIICILTSIQALSASYCNKQVELIVANIASISNVDFSKVDSRFTEYVAFHTKRYEVIVSTDKPKATYEVIVGEYENPGTICEIDSVKRLLK